VDDELDMGAEAELQRRVNPGGVGLPVTAQTLGDLLVRVSMYGLSLREDEAEPVMNGSWGHVSTLVDSLARFAGLPPDALYAVYRSEVARLELELD